VRAKLWNSREALEGDPLVVMHRDRLRDVCGRNR